MRWTLNDYAFCKTPIYNYVILQMRCNREKYIFALETNAERYCFNANEKHLKKHDFSGAFYFISDYLGKKSGKS